MTVSHANPARIRCCILESPRIYNIVHFYQLTLKRPYILLAPSSNNNGHRKRYPSSPPSTRERGSSLLRLPSRILRARSSPAHTPAIRPCPTDPRLLHQRLLHRSFQTPPKQPRSPKPSPQLDRHRQRIPAPGLHSRRVSRLCYGRGVFGSAEGVGGGEDVYAAGGQEHVGRVLWRRDYEGEDCEAAAAVEDEDREEEEGV